MRTRSFPKFDGTEFTYFFLNTFNNSVKIGRSKRVRSRLKDIQVSNCSPIEFLGAVPNRGLERETLIHQMLEPFRIKGEWYHYNEHVKNFIAQILASNNKPYDTSSIIKAIDSF